MTVFESVITIAEFLAWPAAFLAVVLVLRREVRRQGKRR